MIPRSLVTTLTIEKASDILIGGVIGEDEEQDSYVVDMELPGYFAGAVEVAATRYPFVIVGRDVLHELVTHIDGPARTFALTAPDGFLTTSP
jgi:hypothetical protein